MDISLLVSDAQALTTALDRTKVHPRAVMVVVAPETGNVRVWIVPREDAINKHEFYRIVAECISGNDLASLDVGMVQLTRSSNSAIRGLASLMSIQGINDIQMSANSYDGVMLPEGIVIRLDI